MKENEKELTPKQRKFAEEYCIDLNATAAYIHAGYKARGHAAESNASRLLSNAEIQKAIAKKQKELALAFSDVKRLQ
jgi:phage terminase small subunit